MVRIAGIRKIGAMTINAARGKAGELVVHMTIVASDGTMRSCERKWGRVMRERRRLPGRRGMARLARGGKLGETVTGIRGRLKIRSMA
jgi:hypothetical protein